MTIEVRLRRAHDLSAVLEQAVLGTTGVYPDGFHAGLGEIAELIRDDLAAIKRALPTATINLEAPDADTP